MPIEYDASLEALIHPGLRPTVFTPDQAPSLRLLAVESARLAYITAESDARESRRLSDALHTVGFTDPAFFVDAATGSYAYCAQRPSDGLAMVAFRGTEPDDPRDLMIDLRFLPSPWGAGRVHAGFAAAASALREPVQRWLTEQASSRQRLLLCGHSLGAALATLFAGFVDPTFVITIGSPRVGDADFVDSLPVHAMTRIVNCSDIVTTLPPELPVYHHAGSLLYIDRDGAPHEGAADDFVMRDRLHAQGDHLWRTLVKPDVRAVFARPLSDHSPINYVRAFL